MSISHNASTYQIKIQCVVIQDTYPEGPCFIPTPQILVNTVFCQLTPVLIQKQGSEKQSALQKVSVENYTSRDDGFRSLQSGFDFQILSGNRTSQSSNTQGSFTVVATYLNFMGYHHITPCFQLHHTFQSLAVYFFTYKSPFSSKGIFFLLFFSFIFMPCFLLSNSKIPST